MALFRPAHALDRDTRAVIAQEISDHFGAHPSEYDMEDNPHAAMAAFEVEEGADEEFIEEIVSELFVDDALGYDEDAESDFMDLLYDDEDDQPDPKGLGRVRASSALRSQYGILGLGRKRRGASSGRERKNRGPGFLKGLGKMLGLGGLLREAGSGFLQSEGATSLLESAAPGITSQPLSVESLAQQAGSALGTKASEAVSMVTPEAGAESLPPTYVADEETLDHAVVESDEIDLEMSESFGATAKGGFVGRLHRPRAKKAAINSLWRGQQALNGAPYGPKSTFVEEPSSDPVLLSDGQIVDSVHGSLCPVPCPSCAKLKGKAAFGAMAQDCMVCDGYGAILVQEQEVPSFASSETYGFLPFLIPLVTGGVQIGKKVADAKKEKRSSDIDSRKAAVMQRLLAKRAAASAPSSQPAPEEFESMTDSVAAGADQGMADLEEVVAGMDFDDLTFDEDDDVLYGFDDESDDIEDDIDEMYGFDDDDDDDLEIDDDDDDDEEDYVLLRALSPAGRR